MALTIGTRLGPYEILSAIGAGGMGEVYRARDTQLKREVAIKVLPDAFSDDPDRLVRFQREAELLAALNHPNIAAVYGLEKADGITAIVLELVEGQTLADRIARGPMALDEALPIAKGIAEALEAAHERGIIHRDLKPANIKVREDGTVKVLDFGLAKVREVDAGSAGLSNSPTMMAASMPGMIFGTAAYMSPEQAKGQEVDRRSDVWAFGCVLYETLAGRAVFEGGTGSEILSEILKSEPHWHRLPASTPEGLRRLLRRCLQKDRRLRLHDMADARIEIDEVQNAPHIDGCVTPGLGRSRERLTLFSSLGIVTLIAAVLAARAFRPAPAVAEMRVDIATPPTTDLVSLAISPDAKNVVFVATAAAQSLLWLRALESASARPLEGTDAASLPFWSPDSRSVGFFADGKLKRIDIDGGSPTVLANAPFGRGGAWNRDGAILFVPHPGSPILKIPATGGESVAVTKAEAPQQFTQFPQFLPDGRHFLYYVAAAPDLGGVYVGELGGSETKRVLAADAAAVYAPSGQLLFVRRGTLFAQDFDPARLTLGGSSFPVAEHVAVQGLSAALSAAGNGPIVYRLGSTDSPRRLEWFDRSGKVSGTVGDPGDNLSGFSLSSDGRRVAVFKLVNGNTDIYLLETGRAVLNRLTVDAADDIFPIWSPDGSRVVFSSTRRGGLDLYLKSASGIGTEELLLATPQIKAATDWSPDGRFLLYLSSDPATGFDIWALPMDGDRKPFPVVQTKSNERLAQFSPDGKWIAYESDESGRYEIYIQSWSGSGGPGGGKVPVSTTGGAQVRWRHDGKELFYIAFDDRLMAVPIRFASNGQTVEPGLPVPLFPTHVGGQVFPRHQYQVSPDDMQFLMSVERDITVSPITVLLNWKPKP